LTEITATQLRDFQLCRHLYNRKHNDGLQERKNLPARELLGVEFDEALTKAVKWYYFELMAGNQPSFRALMWKWEKLWFKNVTVADIMQASDDPGKNRNSYNTDAHSILSNFINTHKNPGDVYMFNEHYTVPLTDTIKISGTIDLVLIKNRQVIIKQIAPKGPRAYSKGTELGYKLILDSVAFRHISGGNEHKVSMDYIKDNKTMDLSITDVDITNTKALATEIEVCSNFYPSPGCYFCNQCWFKKDCWTHGQ
jgi:hypothetical protein